MRKKKCNIFIGWKLGNRGRNEVTVVEVNEVTLQHYNSRYILILIVTDQVC